jgi:RNA polymerase sigma factor (TIGR02999 family)
MAKFRQGDPVAAGQLVEACLPELRRLAFARMSSERADHTWQPTVLVHELYLELAKVRRLEGGSGVDDQEKAAFLGFADRVMKRLLVHHARPLHRRTDKVEFQEWLARPDPRTEALGDVEDALSRLAAINPKFRTVVEMRVFEGCTVDDIAPQLGCSPRTVASYWNFAKRWLQKEWAGTACDDL